MIIRLAFPALTEERRKSFVKIVKTKEIVEKIEVLWKSVCERARLPFYPSF